MLSLVFKLQAWRFSPGQEEIGELKLFVSSQNTYQAEIVYESVAVASIIYIYIYAQII